MNNIDTLKINITRNFIRHINKFIDDNTNDIKKCWNNALFFYMNMYNAMLGSEIAHHMPIEIILDESRKNELYENAANAIQQMQRKAFDIAIERILKQKQEQTQ